MIKYVSFVFFCLLYPFSLLQSNNLYLETVESAASQIEKLLPKVRAKPEDLSLRPLWHLPHTISKVEELLHSPLQASVHLASWSARVLEFHSFSDFTDFSSALLTNPSSSSPHFGRRESEGYRWASLLPAEIQASVSAIIEAIKIAQPLLLSSYEKLSEEESENVLAFYDFFGIQLFQPRQKRMIFQAMEKFNQEALLSAGQILLKTIDQEMPLLKKIAEDNKKLDFQQVRIKTGVGDVLISGKNDDHYNPESLKDVVLLVDFGGKNSYEGRVAGAKKGEIKIVIDFGDEVTILSTEPVSQGAGVFGIGLIFLMNPSGKNNLSSSSYSQGVGICGIGGLFSRGSGNFEAERYAQGAGIFGMGYFEVYSSSPDANRSTFLAHKYAQGVGFTRGLGIFKANSSHSHFKAGLVEPDPREPLGMSSLCQGVGFGVRGYAGGGLGICAISGNQNEIEASYFAQGTGYWHGAGTFYISGSSNTLQSRRYAQGSGVHTAIGSFYVKGNQNQIINWGVGPAYGWDTGIGWAGIVGNQNSLQAEWGTGTANFNRSRSFFFLLGDGNRLKLPGFGSAFYTRDFTDYAIHWIDGKENQFFHSHFERKTVYSDKIFVSPWGIVRLEDTILTDKIKPALPVPEWKKFSQKNSAISKINLLDELKAAFNLSGKEKVEKLLTVASLFSGEKQISREALAQLLVLPEDELKRLVELIEPQDVEQWIQIRTAVGIHSDLLFSAIVDALNQLSQSSVEEGSKKKAVLLSLLSLNRIKSALPLLLKFMDNSEDDRIQSAACRSLGNLFNRDRGTIPGRISILETLESWLKSFFPSKKQNEELFRHLTNRPFAETVAIFSILRNWNIEEKIFFLKNAPEDINGPFEREKVKEILPLLRKHKKEILTAIKAELEDAQIFSSLVREKLILNLQGKEIQNGLAHSCLVALGQIQDAQDVEVISRYLKHSSALVRDGASFALGRIGSPSLKLLEKLYAEGNAEQKIQVLLSSMATSDSALLSLLRKGFEDQNAKVRKAALSMLNNLQMPLQKMGEKLKKSFAKKISEEDQVQQLYLWKE